MNSVRRYIVALLTLLSAEVMAQNDSILVAGRDTIAYRYTPIESVSAKRKVKGEAWNKFVRYVAESSIDRSFERKVDLTLAPGLYYTNNTSFGVALAMAGLYRLDRNDRSLPASSFSIYATASLTGFYRVGAKGVNIFKGDKRRIAYEAEFYSQPTDFWGLGYEQAMSNGSVRYNGSRSMADVRFLQRVVKGFYVGVGANFDYQYTRAARKGKEIDYDAFKARLGGQRTSYYALGLSLLAEYDTRDFIPNPQRGVYIALRGTIRPKGTSDIGRWTFAGRFVADYYQRLWKGAVLAMDLRAELNSNGTPWVFYASMGGATSMRGYYAGRFSDLCAVTIQAELRQKIYKALGSVAWAGAGNVFSYNDFAWRRTMPNYGVGLRYEFKRGVNLRLDYGFGGRDAKGDLIHGAVFSINEAF